MSNEKTVKVRFLRTHDTGTAYHAKGSTADLPEAAARALAAAKRPVVEILAPAKEKS